jgi:uncharacterized protein DUF4440
MKIEIIAGRMNGLEDERERVSSVMRQINEAWLAGRVEDLGAMVHDEIVMVFPGFAGRIQGRDTFVAGFRDFCATATMHQFKEGEYQVDIVGETAVVSFGYEMLYERSAEKYRAIGRDLWIFGKQATGWIALWRMMLDLSEAPAEYTAGAEH